MTEKETASYEAMAGMGHNQQHKPPAAVLQLTPQLTSKPTKQQQEGSNNRSNDSQGYYSNVAQKGKLILPTALWILLIIAGASFLTLLASLSRTIDTLDTLVELEQDKEARTTVSEHLHRLHHQREAAEEERRGEKHRHEHEKAKQQHQEGDLDFSDSSPLSDGWLNVIPHKSSWFSMPSWTSLEPPVNSPLIREDSRIPSTGPMSLNLPHLHREDPPMPSGRPKADVLAELGLPPQVEGLVDDMMHQMMAAAGASGQSAPEISGRIIISSSSDEPSSPMGPARGGAPDSLLSSILRQVQPMLHSLGMNKMMPDAPRPLQQDTQGDEKPLVSANIENLNINMGSEENDSNKRRPNSREDEANSLEKSIENFVDQLMDQKPSRVALGHEKLPDFTMVEGEPILSFRESGPLDESRRGRLEPHHNQPHHRKRPAMMLHGPSPLSPLSAFLMGPLSSSELSDRHSEHSGPSPFEMLMPIGSALNKKHQYHNQHQGAPFESISQMFDDANRQDSNDDKPTLIVSISGDNDDAQQEQRARPSGEMNRHGLSNTRRPLFGRPPYEQIPSLSSFLTSLNDLDRTNDSIGNKKSRIEQSASSSKPSDAERAKWDMLSNDLAESILDSVLQPPANTPQPSESSPLSSVIMVNGKPLADGEGQKLLDSLFGSNEEASGDKKNSASAPESEMFNMLFGLPSRGSKVITDELPASTTNQRNEEAKSTSGQSLVEKMLNGLQDKIMAESTASSGTAGGQADSSSISTAKQTSDDPDASGSSSTKTATDESEFMGQEASQMINDFMKAMFTLPQLSGDTLQASVGSSNGGEAGSSSSGSSLSPVEPSQITTATPLATNEPMAPASRLDSTTFKPIVVSSTLPNNSNSNSTELKVGTQVDASKSMTSTNKGINLPNDRIFSEFFGLKENEPLVLKEEVTLPSTTSISTTTTTTTKNTKQTRVEEVTTGSPRFTMPTATSVASTNPSSTSTTTSQNSKAHSVAPELIRQEDAPSNMPVLDLAPFAKSSTPLEDGGTTKKDVISSTKAPAMEKVVTTAVSTTPASAPQPPVATTQQVKNMTTTSNATTVGLGTTSKTTEKPPKSLLERADDFIERNLFDFRKLF